MADDRSEKQTIEGYFHQGYENDVILEFLSVYHNITISLSTFKRCLRAYGMLRVITNEVNEQEVKAIVTREIDNRCGVLGYRAICHLLRLEYHLHVPRHLVAEVDPYITMSQLFFICNNLFICSNYFNCSNFFICSNFFYLQQSFFICSNIFYLYTVQLLRCGGHFYIVKFVGHRKNNLCVETEIKRFALKPVYVSLCFESC